MMKRTILSLLFGTASMFAMAQNQTVSHVVQRGETLESIAEYYNVSVEDIDKANPNMDGVVYVGLKLFGAAGFILGPLGVMIILWAAGGRQKSGLSENRQMT